MKCPLFWSSVINSPREVESKHGDCLQEGCAWWSDAYKSCAVLRLAYHVGDLVEQVERLNDGIRLVK